jgi:prenylcysteine oxidase/farnesylcysteine lyase
LRLDKGLFYVNAIEPFISTMETSTIAGRNAVDLLLQEEFGSGLCLKPVGPADVEQQVLQIPPSPSMEAEDFVLGWDC